MLKTPPAADIISVAEINAIPMPTVYQTLSQFLQKIRLLTPLTLLTLLLMTPLLAMSTKRHKCMYVISHYV